MAEVKALVINSKEALQGASGKWQDLSSQMHSLTRNIITPKLSDEADSSAMVSGVPSVFAREKLFVHSLNEAETLRTQKNKGDDSGLAKYYLDLVDEWRGFIAFIALNSGKLEAKRIELAYSDDKVLGETSNIFEPKGAFGNMLFENRNLWTDPNDLNKLKKPFIYVLKYNGKVVGGTSPRSLLFTSVAYSIEEESPCVDRARLKFTDPLQSNPNLEQLTALYAYIKQLLPKIEKLEKDYKGQVEYKAIKQELNKWEGEIRSKITEQDIAKSSAWPVNLFKTAPFNIFDFSDKLYGWRGVIRSERESDEWIEFDANDLLLPKDSVIARLNVSPEMQKNQKNSAEMPVYTLKARVAGSNECAFFALPISETGLGIFSSQNSLEAFLNERENQEIKSNITAVFDNAVNKLEVTLNVITNNNKQKTINVEYNVGRPMSQNDMLIWPNFISEQWNKYYLYSELPHNINSERCPFRAVPFVGVADKDLVGIRDIDNNIKYLKDTDCIAVTDSRTSDQIYKYEIYQSEFPFKGVLMTSANKPSGFFIIRYDSVSGNDVPTYYPNKTLEEVTLGVDFGSTNTAIAYFGEEMQVAKGLDLANQVVSLLQSENMHNKKFTTEKNLLFYQSDEIPSNKIKSILAVQNDQHLPQSEISDKERRFTYIGEAVKGGMPCFRTEIPIKPISGRDDQMLVEFPGDSQVTLIRDMKWKDSPEEKAHKSAYLSSLIMHVYANLFEMGYVPTKLNWSYPSAMPESLKSHYYRIWHTLEKISPVKDYSLSVAGATFTGGLDEQDWSQNESSDDGWSNSGSGWSDNDNWGAVGESKNSDDSWGNNSDSSQSNDSWGNSSDSWGAQDNSWGGSSSADTQSSKKKSKDLPDLKPDNGPVDFNFVAINQNEALTEACAVANYLSRKGNSSSHDNVLTMSFDIGGSTTDISVLCRERGETYMIKQNSIRFAAQRLSQAAREVWRPFGNVLKRICHANKLQILGLNTGPDLYNQGTADYFFEQIVDLLNEQQLGEFYRALQAECPGLFNVNLYVTGLIMFYAGQLTTKLVGEVNRAEKDFTEKKNWKPQVEIEFTGKGSRIAEWFMIVDSRAALNYYREMFVEGMGGMAKAQQILQKPPTFKLDPNHPKTDKEVKYEVAKGLALSKGGDHPLMFTKRTIEILGEEGFTLQNPKTGETFNLDYDNSITEEMMKYISVYFNGPLDINPMKTRFFQFIKVFYKYASQMFNFKMSQQEILNGISAMNYNRYIQNLPEYRKASDKGTFDFVAPIIILEGMKFYDEYLLKGIRQ